MTTKPQYKDKLTPSREFISFLEEVYKHLIKIDNKIINKKVNNEVLIELGIIYELEQIEELSYIIQKKCSFSFEDFLNNLNKIQHDDADKLCEVPLYCKRCRSLIRDKELKSPKPTLIDLFCGAGGMSLGFKQSGFRIVYANDKDASCIQTYTFNHPEVNPDNIILGDIEGLSKSVLNHLGNQSVDVVIGGPPCQGFSTANRQRVIDDPRNRLYKEYVRVVEDVKPNFFVMENVIGMKKKANQIIEDFNNVGYDVDYEILNAVDFSVPQNRRRIVFIGNRKGINNRSVFSEIMSESKRYQKFSLEDAIGDLPKLAASTERNATEVDSSISGKKISEYNLLNHNNNYLNLINKNNNPLFLYNHKARYNNDRDIEIFGRLNQGDDSTDHKIADIMPYKSRNNIFKDKYYKLVYGDVCKTITAHMRFDCNMYIHPTQARGLTPREAARVQSYPDTYFFKGSYTKTYMQIGNSVPPIMSGKIADVIKDKILNFDLSN